MVAPVRHRRLRRAASPQSGVTLLSSFDYTGITICTFGPFTLDPSTRQLLRAGIAVSLSPKAFDALVYLIEHRDRVVRKDELLTAVWPDVVVQESSLTQLIFILRKALDPQGDGVEYIATASRYGYRFVAPIDAIGVTEAGLAESAVAAGELPSGRGARGRSARAWPRIGVAIAAGAVVVAAVTVATVYRLRARPEVHPIRMFLRPTENTMPRTPIWRVPP
jgi:DNA-binding winged helix-turn-helix (wHTH) protein